MADALTGTPFSVIFDSALSKIQDYDLANLTQEECYSVLSEYIRPSCVKFRVCKLNLGDRDDLLQIFNATLPDDVIEIISNGVVIEYLYAKYVKTPMILKPLLANSRDFSVFSPGNHLEKLQNLHILLVKENEQLISMYSWRNSTLFGGVS